MNFQEYLASLVECGVTPADAERVARLRFARNRQSVPGRIRAEKSADGEGEVLIYEAIGFDYWSDAGMTPKRLMEQLSALGPVNRLTVRINSPGGDVFDAMTIYNILLRQTATVAVEVEGLAASAASFVAQAASPGELRVSEAGMMMVHRAWGAVMGNHQDMIDMAAVLEKLDSQIAAIYANRSSRKVDTWLSLMAEETWFTGQEAVDAKLADAVTPAKRAAASLGLQHFQALGALPEKAQAVRQQWEAQRAKGDQEEASCRQQMAEAVAVRLRMLELEEVSA